MEDDSDDLRSQLDAILPRILNLLQQNSMQSPAVLCVQTVVPALQLLRMNLDVLKSDAATGEQFVPIPFRYGDHIAPVSLQKVSQLIPDSDEVLLEETVDIDCNTDPVAMQLVLPRIRAVRTLEDEMNEMNNHDLGIDGEVQQLDAATASQPSRPSERSLPSDIEIDHFNSGLDSMEPIPRDERRKRYQCRANLTPSQLSMRTSHVLLMGEPDVNPEEFEELADVGSRRNSFKISEMKSNRGSGIGAALVSPSCFINPGGTPRVTWDMLSMGLIFVVIVTVPLELCFFWETEPDATTTNVGFYWTNLVVDIWFLIDIVLNFFTGYIVGQGAHTYLVSSPYLIGKRYARGWLWLDLLATFPFPLIIRSFAGSKPGSTEGSAVGASGMLRVLKVAKCFRMLKVIRALKLNRLVQVFEEQMIAAPRLTVAWQLWKIGFIMLLMSHCACCVWFMVGYLGQQQSFTDTWLSAQGLQSSHPREQYIASIYFIITTGTTVGYGDIHATNELEQLIGVLLIVGAVAYIGQVLTRVGQVIAGLSQHEAARMKVLRDAMIFMVKRNIEKSLSVKVLRYIEHVHDTESLTSLDRAGFIQGLSESLQMELRLAIKGSFLKKFPIFENADDVTLKAICMASESRRAGMGDLVVQEGQACEHMYMIVGGEVMVTLNNRPIALLLAEDWFGERALFIEGLVHKMAMRCETHCEFLVLSRHEFLKQVSQFPKLKKEYDSAVLELLRSKSGDTSSDQVTAVSSQTLSSAGRNQLATMKGFFFSH